MWEDLSLQECLTTFIVFYVLRVYYINLHYNQYLEYIILILVTFIYSSSIFIGYGKLM